ncbi:DUF3006 family protein [Halorarius litoreus]|uniref:DUF3006 family protein n=1 Tax=Halorarius litoreus TaxID=2962676 RepID=UPI0020CB9D8C|nr:DUF3006 family protein [Halorarius litoreus]
MTSIELVDGTYTAVVDSVEDGLATIFFEHQGEEIASGVFDAEVLPEEGRHADAILTVVVVEGEFEEWGYREVETEERHEEAQSRFDRLSRRPPSNDES